jgi:hypothetical protein
MKSILLPMSRRVTTKNESSSSSFQHPRIGCGVESSLFEGLDPGQKHAGVTDWGNFGDDGLHAGVTDWGNFGDDGLHAGVTGWGNSI